MGNAAECVKAKFRFVHVQKEHPCFECQATISKGAIALNVAGKIIRWYSYYWCLDCSGNRINGIPDVHSNLKQALLNELKKLKEGS